MKHLVFLFWFLILSACSPNESECARTLEAEYGQLSYYLDRGEIESRPAKTTRDSIKRNLDLCEDTGLETWLFASGVGPNDSYMSVMDVAVISGHSDFISRHIDFLQPNSASGRDNDQLLFGGLYMHLAAQYGSIESIDSLLALGISVDHGDKSGFTALHLTQGRTPIGLRVMTHLVGRGADLERQSNSRHTPLEIAILDKDENKALCLLALGAKESVGQRDSIRSGSNKEFSETTGKIQDICKAGI